MSTTKDPPRSIITSSATPYRLPPRVPASTQIRLEPTPSATSRLMSLSTCTSPSLVSPPKGGVASLKLQYRNDGRGDEVERVQVECEGGTGPETEGEGRNEGEEGRGLLSLLFGECFSACQRMSLSEHGLGVYMASPSEIEKFTVCAELADQASDSIGELFVATEVPEPNGGGANGGNGSGGAGAFLKGIFSAGGNASPRGAGPADLDAILLDKPGAPGAGGSMGGAVAMRTVGRTIPGPARLDRAMSTNVSAGQAAQMALQNLGERGDKLNATVDATEALRNSAQNMASRSAKLVEKMEKKKWYNF